MAKSPAFDRADMNELIKPRPAAYVFNGYGHNLLAMDPDSMNSAFSTTLMSVVDQDYITAVTQSRMIEDTISKNAKVYDVYEETLKAMQQEGNSPPTPTWIADDAEFREVMQQRAAKDFIANFSTDKKVDPEAKSMFFECMDRFGPKAFSELNQKLGQLQDRKGELAGLMDEMHDSFEKNAPRIKARWGLDRPDDIMGVGFVGDLPKGFDAADIVKLGRLVIEALNNPETSPIDLLNIKGAVEFRDKYAQGLSEDNKSTFGRAPEGVLAADPNGRFAPPPGKKNDGLDDDDPNNPNPNKPKVSRPFGMGMGAGGF